MLEGLTPIDDVVRVDKQILKVAGQQVRGRGLRVRVILDERSCISCGLVATHAALKKNMSPNSRFEYHVNFYGKDKGGAWVQMTLDHIVPKSKGGTHTRENTQAMCLPCNQHKGHS